MKLSESPYAVGTPEHGEWVRRVFIPAVRDERFETDAAVAGAQSIGRQRVALGISDFDRLFVQTQMRSADQAHRELADAMVQLAGVFAPSVQEILRWIDGLVAECRPNPTLPVIASQRRRRHRGR